MTILQSVTGAVDRTRRAPRAGWRALVTRPRDEAGPLAAALSARGIEAIIEPLLDIRFRTEPAPDLRGVQALVFTSANGARAFARVSRERNLPAFAVGDATAARARAEGFVEVESAAGDVASLVALVRQRTTPAKGRLMHVAGSVLAGDLASDLRVAGFALERAVLYEAAPASRLSSGGKQAIEAGLVDFALFFSPRTAAIFARLAAQEAVLDKLRHVRAVSISAMADAALDEIRFRGRNVAGQPDQNGVLAVLDKLIVESRR